jgi:D-hydroxyproline dehydrogenase subunit gamma
MPDFISVQINGKPVRVARGSSVAAAVFQAGEQAFHYSVSGEPRAALCGMGICFECRLTIDGKRNFKSCQIVATEGMLIETT